MTIKDFLIRYGNTYQLACNFGVELDILKLARYILNCAIVLLHLLVTSIANSQGQLLAINVTSNIYPALPG